MHIAFSYRMLYNVIHKEKKGLASNLKNGHICYDHFFIAFFSKNAIYY